MSTALAPDPDLERAAAPAPLPSLAEVLESSARSFSREGALGVVVVDGSALYAIERSYGAAARERAMRALGAIVREACQERLQPEDRIVTGDVGRPEILLLLFRAANDAWFYREELPALFRVLTQGLARSGHRAVYPYSRKAPALHAGSAVTLLNPAFAPETHVRTALEEARADAALNAKIDARRRRRRFLGLLLEEGVYSVYEPVVEVATRTVFGYEALARGPAGSDLHSPMVLFELAGELGLVNDLDRLCRRRGLEGALGLPAGTKLFLNCRPAIIHDPSFKAEALCRTLEQSQLRPCDVVFEISEQESIENFSLFREMRDQYGNLGFQIALDDTGAGYASLQTVMELAPEYIKVDRSFIQGIDADPARQELLRALHSVAGRIHARIIAEGLDTLEELTTLGELGIPFGQGWLFGHPHPLRATRG